MNKRFSLGLNIALVIFSLLFPCFSIASELEDSKFETGNQIATGKETDKEGNGKAHLFERAIFLISCGSLGAAASLHSIYSERKRIASQINQLDRYIRTTCCIVNSTPTEIDIEPILEEIKKEEIEMENELESIRIQETSLLNKVSVVEGKLTRLVHVGRT